jgi:hypothetical protein
MILQNKFVRLAVLVVLAKALRVLELEDEHIFEIERCVEKIMAIE